jgi:hypothetical protein
VEEDRKTVLDVCGGRTPPRWGELCLTEFGR